MRGGWRSADRQVDLFAFARNFTNASSVIGAIDFNNLTAFVNEARVIGIGTALRF